MRIVTSSDRSQAGVKMYFRSRSGSGADPSDPARKLKKALARKRICRDGNSQLEAFSTKHGKMGAGTGYSRLPSFFPPRFKSFSTGATNSL